MNKLGSWLKKPSYFFDDLSKLSGAILLSITLLVIAIAMAILSKLPILGIL